MPDTLGQSAVSGKVSRDLSRNAYGLAINRELAPRPVLE
jgi:hypothetical protein